MMAITVTATVNAPLQKVWDYFTQPAHITNWNFAHESWCCPKAVNNLVVDGTFNYRMEAVDGSMGFDFEGVYSQVVDGEKFCYGLADGRQIEVTFAPTENGTIVTETFDPENENPIAMQEAGWQAILNNFKDYTEKNADIA